MGRPRFSRIKTAQRYYNELTELISYQKGEKPSMGPGVGNGTDLGNFSTLYLKPFNRTLPANTYSRTRARQTHITNWEASFGDHIIQTLAADTEFAMPLDKWTPAKVQVVSGSTTKTVKTSAITGRQYLKYNRSSRQLPFGRSKASTTESQQTAFTAIRTALAGTVPSTSKILHIPEST